MNLNKLLSSFVIGLGFILISTALAQDPEEPLISIVTEEIDTVSSDFSFFSPPDASAAPGKKGSGDTYTFSVGPNLIVNAPQFFNVPPAAPPFGLVGRSETAIAVDEDDGIPGENVVVGWNDADGFISPFLLDGTSGWGFSNDGGGSFVDGGGLPPVVLPTSPPTTIVAAGDPWLDIWRDDLGNGIFLYSNLAVRAAIGGNGPGVGNFVVQGVLVHRGIVDPNGVMNWQTPTLIPSPPPTGFFGLDKEAITVDHRSGSRAVYVSATNFTNTGSNIVVFNSTDGGLTFSGPTQVQGPGVDGVQGSMPAVGINGDVYVVWERGRFNHPLVTPSNPFAKIQFARSTDGGATFSSAIDVDAILAAARKPPVGYNRSRHNDFPRIAVAHNGFHQGRIYVVYHDAGTNPDLPGTVTLSATGTGIPNPALPGVADADILLKYSDDGGLTWNGPTIVNGTAGDGKAQFWPCVSIGEGGQVAVVYHEDLEVDPTPANPNDIVMTRGLDGFGTNPLGNSRVRRSTTHSMVDTYVAVSTNGGTSFLPPVKITDFTSNWSLTLSNIIPNMGDYLTSVTREIDASTTRVYASWQDSRALADVVSGPGVLLRPVPSAAYGSVEVVKHSSNGGGPFAVGVIPKSSALVQNYPNPFNASTIIEYILPADGLTKLTVYNILGQKVAKLVDEFQTVGNHQVKFDASNLSSGVYFYTLESGKLLESNRMTLLK